MLFAFVAFAGTAPASDWAQSPPTPVIAENASESFLVENIKRLGESSQPGVPIEIELSLHGSDKLAVLVYIDELLERYPQSTFRQRALIIKLETLAQLARGRHDYLQQLLSVTAEIAAGKPQGKLASENAFFAIQAFVLGARYEGMPEERRIKGTIERYEAFLEDYPDSTHWPVISASLIRSLIATDRIDRAKTELARLSRRHPQHRALGQAQGEVYAATAIGKPFDFSHTTPAGETITAKEHQGKVLVLHFWASRDLVLAQEVPELVKLYADLAPKGLQMVSVNLDRERPRADEVLRLFPMSWPQFFEPRGRRGAGLVERGVGRTPTYFVMDRDGVLRHAGRADNLRELVVGLLAEPTGAGG